MSRLNFSPIVVLVFLCFSEISYGQLWSGILGSSRAVDWSQAGSAHINDTRTQCGSTLTSPTAASINSAIAACGANQYVLIGPGTFSMSTGISFGGKSDVTLRGSGANSTFLNFGTSTPQHLIEDGDASGNWWGSPNNTATWTAASYAKGQTAITLSSIP